MIQTSKRKALFSELKKYCHHSGDNDYMEVTEWSNDVYDKIMAVSCQWI